MGQLARIKVWLVRLDLGQTSASGYCVCASFDSMDALREIFCPCLDDIMGGMSCARHRDPGLFLGFSGMLFF